MNKRNVVTVAVGNDYYYGLATNLVRSFLIHNDPTEISLQLLTDNVRAFNEFSSTVGVHLIALTDLSPDDKSFTSKFHLWKHIKYQYNLFIDCDCIVYKNLNYVFDKFAGYDFSVIGDQKKDGEFFGDIRKVRERFNLEFLPQFVGSVYYYTNSEVAKRIFMRAEELKRNYDEIGLVRLRNKENEEPLIAIAMAAETQKALPEDGTIKADCMFFKECRVNVLSGKVKLAPLTSYEHKEIHFNPAIVHFNASFSDTWIYKLEAFRLATANYSFFTDLRGRLLIQLPPTTTTFLRNMLRPVYHKFFGFRKISPSKRTEHLGNS